MDKIAGYIKSGKLKNPDHKVIKDAARALLFSLDHTPTEKLKVLNELRPLALFRNGLKTPNNKPPLEVYILLDSEVFTFSKKDKKWKNMGEHIPQELHDLLH